MMDWGAMSRAERDAAYNNSAAVTNSAELNAAREAASAAFRAAHQYPPPSIRGGVADGPEERLAWRCVEWAGAQLEGRLQRETIGMCEPRFVVLESRSLPILARARP